MSTILIRLTLLVLFLATAVSAATSLPALLGGHLEGQRLLAHMMASGVVVTTLPLLAVLVVSTRLGTPGLGPPGLGVIEAIGFWTLMLCGTVTIATMFVSMLPVASTTTMSSLIELHGWSGFATATALLVMTVGMSFGRRRSTI